MNRRYMDVVRIKMIKEKRTAYEITKFSDSREAGMVVGDFLTDLDRECFLAVLLDAKNKMCSIYPVSIGSLDCTVTHPREVFKAAILSNAKSIILAYNHPSGDL